MRILIVDDSRAIQNIVRRGLEKAGYSNLDIKMASDGIEALDVARHWEPDLIITDWHMPGMTGIELLHSLNREMLGIKVGFVTTETSKTRLDEAKQAGARFIVNKPFEMATLVNTVLPVLEEEQQITAYKNAPPEVIAMANSDDLARAINKKTLREVFLEPTDPLSADELKTPYVLAFFCSPINDKVRGLCLLDKNAVNIIAGAVLNAQETDVRANCQANSIEPEYKTACDTILQTIGETFLDTNTQQSAKLKLGQANLVKKPFAKLKSILTTATDRIDLEIAVLGYGQGHMIVVTS